MYKVRSVLDSNEIMRRIAELKQNCGCLISNFYLSEEGIRKLVRQRALYMVSEPDGILLLKLNNQFYNLYFFSSGIDSLKKIVSKVEADKDVVVDLISRKTDGTIIREAFSDFSDYAVFQRMVKLGRNYESACYNEQAVVKAASVNADDVFEIITSRFDHLSEHLPNFEEVKKAIEQQNILIIKEQGRIAALLFFEIMGVSSILRYWFTDCSFRGLGLGSKLMKSYFANSEGIKRYLLWVNCSNIKAIKKYENFGYQPDGTVDIIVVKR